MSTVRVSESTAGLKIKEKKNVIIVTERTNFIRVVKAGIRGAAGDSVRIKKDVFILNADNIEDKKIILSEAPLTDWIMFYPDGGPAQREGIDFEFDKDKGEVSWNSKGLDEVLLEDDRIEVHYLFNPESPGNLGVL